MSFPVQVTMAVFALLVFAIDPAQGAGPEVIKTELLTLSFNGSVPGYYYLNGKKVHELNASRQGISPPIHYVGPRVLRLYKKKSDLNPVPKGQEPPKPLLTVKIPPGTDRTLLAFAFSKENKEVPSVKAYGISDDRLGEGDYQIYNFSKQNVYVMLNDMKSAVPPGKEATIKGSKLGKKVQDMKVAFGMKSGTEVRAAYSSIWGHRPERRSFLFVFDQDDRNRPLQIRRFYDVPSFRASERVLTTEGPPS